MGGYLHKLVSSYEYRSRWHNLSALGTSPVVRLSILMPIAGYLILLNAEFVKLADIDQRFKLSILSESPWRLVLFFFGTSFLGFASVLFGWRCPGLPKRYRAAVDFVNAESEFFSTESHYQYLIAEFRQVLSRLPQWASKKNIIARADDLVSDLLEDQGEAMTIYWHGRDLEQPRWRIAICILYDTGLVLIAIPAIITFLGVCRHVASWIHT